MAVPPAMSAAVPPPAVSPDDEVEVFQMYNEAAESRRSTYGSPPLRYDQYGGYPVPQVSPVAPTGYYIAPPPLRYDQYGGYPVPQVSPVAPTGYYIAPPPLLYDQYGGSPVPQVSPVAPTGYYIAPPPLCYYQYGGYPVPQVSPVAPTGYYIAPPPLRYDQYGGYPVPQVSPVAPTGYYIAPPPLRYDQYGGYPVPEVSPVAPIGSAPVHPPSNTLFVGNLGKAPDEAELRDLFSGQRGFKEMRFHQRRRRAKICYIEFEDVKSAVDAHQNLHEAVLSTSDRGAIRIEYSMIRD